MSFLGSFAGALAGQAGDYLINSALDEKEDKRKAAAALAQQELEERKAARPVKRTAAYKGVGDDGPTYNVDLLDTVGNVVSTQRAGPREIGEAEDLQRKSDQAEAEARLAREVADRRYDVKDARDERRVKAAEAKAYRAPKEKKPDPPVMAFKPTEAVSILTGLYNDAKKSLANPESKDPSLKNPEPTKQYLKEFAELRGIPYEELLKITNPDGSSRGPSSRGGARKSKYATAEDFLNSEF